MTEQTGGLARAVATICGIGSLLEEAATTIDQVVEATNSSVDLSVAAPKLHVFMTEAQTIFQRAHDDFEAAKKRAEAPQLALN